MQLEQHQTNLLFTEARSQNGWLDKPVSEAQLRQLYDLMKMGPTSMNCSPARIVFASSLDAKKRLATAVAPGNVEKTVTAPVLAIIGYDLQFAQQLPTLFPHRPEAAKLFEGKPELTRDTAFRNSSLQGAYLIIAARSLGLDTGPMSGFDAGKVEELFFPEGGVKANFLCGLGYGDSTKVHTRSPRLSFEQACSIV